jgi:hypothetical protein
VADHRSKFTSDLVPVSQKLVDGRPAFSKKCTRPEAARTARGVAVYRTEDSAKNFAPGQHAGKPKKSLAEGTQETANPAKYHALESASKGGRAYGSERSAARTRSENPPEVHGNRPENSSTTCGRQRLAISTGRRITQTPSSIVPGVTRPSTNLDSKYPASSGDAPVFFPQLNGFTPQAQLTGLANYSNLPLNLAILISLSADDH